MNKDSIVVYYSMGGWIPRQTVVKMLWGEPQPLMKLLPSEHKDSDDNYKKCPALRGFSKNIYGYRHPLETEVSFMGDYLDPIMTGNEDLWQKRKAGSNNSYSCDYRFQFFFFTEDSLKARQTPPYLHNTTASQYAILASGEFDIGRWFRPFNLTYILHEGLNVLKLKKDDPAVYFEFMTNKKIILKQFEMTEELLNISISTSLNKNNFPKDTLENGYNRFMNTKRNKRVLKLIKQNLLDEEL
jgi:hypothetical protein